MKERRTLVSVLAVACLLTWASYALAAEIRAVGVLENNPSKYSSCVAISEDGQWVVGNSKKMDSNLVLCDWPFYWSKTGGLQDLGNPAGGNSYATGCASLWNGSLVACGNVGGMARKWLSPAWSVLPGQGTSVRSVYCISRNEATQETWIGGSTYPAENEKAYRYQWSNNGYLDFWGYYQDIYGIAHSGWAVGKNNFGNGYPSPDYRYNHPIFIFDWSLNCAGGGNCGWDQLNRFAGYGDDQYYKGVATAISPGAKWAVGYMTYNPALVDPTASYHAFKWAVPANPQPAPQPWVNWPRPVDIGVLSGDEQSVAYCVAENGTTAIIGGRSYLASRGEKAVYWDGTGIHDLYTELANRGVDLTRWSGLARVLGISYSTNGMIMCGFGYYDDDGNSGTPAIQMGFVADFSTNPQPPVITQQPQDQNTCQGGTATFLIDAAGDGPITYRWQRNQVNLSDGGHYSGTTTPLLTISTVDSGDVGNYRCVASNPYGSTNSNEAVLAVPSSVPAVPPDGTPTADATDKITWKWTDVAAEAGYRVKDTGGTNLSGNLMAGITQWQESSLVANTQYTRKVYAFNGCGESAGSAGQSRYTLAAAPTYSTGTTSPTVTCDKGQNTSGLTPAANVTFTATNGFGDGPSKVGQFGYLWDQAPGNPPSWPGEQFWTSGTLVKQVGASGNWYLHLRSYNNDTPKAVNATVLNLGPYIVGAAAVSCLQNADFEGGFTSGVGNHWTKFNYGGNVTCSDETLQKHGGSHCQGVYSATSSNEGGVYQQFDTTPGLSYTVRVWVKCSGGQVCGYLGVDPYGGTDSHSGNIQWLSANYTTWGQKSPVAPFTAQGGKMTVFLDAAATGSTAGTVWFDDAEPVCTIPGAPTDGTPVALSTTGIRWMWSDVTGETGYRVKDTGGVNLSGDLAANSTQWDETSGISPNTQYTRKIYAFAPGGESSGSAGQSRYSLIPAPTGVAFGAVTSSSIAASPTGTLANLTAGSSGVRTSNTTASTGSGWVQSQAAWTSSGLAANTQYSFLARARNGESVETADSPAATKYTLSVPPGPGSMTPGNPSPCPNDPVIWTAVSGFGAGAVQYYRWVWDQNSTHTWTGSETQWSAGTLPTWPTSNGAWYLHVQGYNAENVANGTYDYVVNVTRAPTAITQHPTPQTVSTGGTASFSVAATGDGTLSYRWQKGGTDLSDGGHYSGVTTTTLAVSNADSSDAASYRCVVTGACGSATSNVATLTVRTTVPADFDADGDVDLVDFATFQGCFNGPNRPIAPACAGADFDHDNDVDLMDFATFQGCFNGPNRPPGC